MELNDAKILYPLNPEIYNKRITFLSLNNKEGGMIDVSSSINFYPCYVPLDQSLVTLSITSEDLLNKMKSMINEENSIIFADLHETKRKNDYVSYGILKSMKVDPSIYNLYNYAAWLGLILDRPQVVKKNGQNGNYTVPISLNRYFHIDNNFRNGKFEADFSYSDILVEISGEDYHNAYSFHINYFSQPLELVSLSCNVVQFNGSQIVKSRLNMAIKKKDYRKIVDSDVGLKIISLYSIYNIKYGNKEYRPLNLVTGVYNFKYSIEELALFVGDIKKSEGLTLNITVNPQALEKLYNKIFSSFNHNSLEITMELPASREVHNNSNIIITIIKPEIIIKLITAYVYTQNRSIEALLESGDIYNSIINFYNQLEKSPFDKDGNMIPANIKAYLMDKLK